MLKLLKLCLLGDALFFLKAFQKYIPLDLLLNAIPRGVGQICFVNNSVVGIVFLVSLIVTMPAQYSILSLLGLFISTVVTLILPALNGEMPIDVRNTVSIGANGFNGFLYGAAISTALVSTDESGHLITKNIGYNCILAIIGGIFVAFITLWARKLLSQFSLPVTTLPFNFAAIMVIGALRYVADYSIPGLPSKFELVPVLPNPVLYSPSWECFPFNESITVDDDMEHSARGHCFGIVMKGIFRGMGQIFFSDDWRVGLTMTLSTILFSPLLAFLIVLGSTVGLLTASFIDVHPAELEAGLWGFNAVLTATALGAVYFRFDWRTVVIAIIGCMFTVFMQGMLKLFLTRHQIPHFTLPYVLTAYVFLLVDWACRIPLGEEGNPEATANCSFSSILSVPSKLRGLRRRRVSDESENSIV